MLVTHTRINYFAEYNSATSSRKQSVDRGKVLVRAILMACPHLTNAPGLHGPKNGQDGRHMFLCRVSFSGLKPEVSRENIEN